MTDSKRILICSADLIHKYFSFNGYKNIEFERVKGIFKSIKFDFISRDSAENNEEFKQIIPYVVFKKDDKFLVYQRSIAVGEKRLAGLKSIGIGGHIEIIDADSTKMDIWNIISNGMHREIDEEIGAEIEKNISFVGIINDESNMVNKVHLGLVFLAKLKSLHVSSKSKEFSSIFFCNASELSKNIDEFETWSKHLIDSSQGISIWR